jgi:hypothetical protein
MKFEVTSAGRKELESPETWAKNKNTVTLVNRLLKGAVEADSITDKERGRLNRWVNLGYLKRTGEATKPAEKKTKTTRTRSVKTTAKTTTDQNLKKAA